MQRRWRVTAVAERTGACGTVYIDFAVSPTFSRRRFVAAIAAAAAVPAPGARGAMRRQAVVRRTLTGVDVLAAAAFAPLRGRRVGLLTNQTGRTRDGATTIDLLAAASDVRLVALFSP